MRKLAGWSILALLLSPVARAGDAVELPAGGYLGSLYFFRLPSATIVYPAGPGEDVETNRFSALSRAGFLRATRGMKVEVAADDALTPEQRSGHLLVLGWRNRLIGTEEVPRPFRKTADGVEFLGITESDPDVDLLFFTESPFNHDSAFLFWSRIDPERDRMLPIPTVGSDWLLEKDYRVIYQGMFEKPHTWPPTREPAAEKDHRPDLAAAARTDARRQSARYDIHYDGAKIPPEEVEAIAKAREAALDSAVAAIGPVPEGYRIRLSVFEDEADKKARVGIPDAAHAIPASRLLFMTRKAARSPSPHEEIHLVAREVLGPCVLSTLYEGLAIAIDGKFRRTDLELLAVRILEQGSLPRLDDLLDENTARSIPDDVRYPLAGLLCRFLLESTDREGLKRAYGMREGSAAGLARAIGRDPATLDAAFRAWLEKRIAARKEDLAFLRAQQDAKDRFVSGDWPGVAEALRRAIAIHPDDFQTRLELAGAEMRTGEYDKAESRLTGIVALPPDPKNAAYVVSAVYELGRLYDVEGFREKALAQYRKVLELPDIGDSHRLASEAIETPVTKENLE